MQEQSTGRSAHMAAPSRRCQCAPHNGRVEMSLLAGGDGGKRSCVVRMAKNMTRSNS